MLSKIEILSDDNKVYSWKAREITPITQYEWEKREVVYPEPEPEPEPSIEDFDIEEYIKKQIADGIVDDGMKVPMEQMTENAYVYIDKSVNPNKLVWFNQEQDNSNYEYVGLVEANTYVPVIITMLFEKDKRLNGGIVGVDKEQPYTLPSGFVTKRYFPELVIAKDWIIENNLLDTYQDIWRNINWEYKFYKTTSQRKETSHETYVEVPYTNQVGNISYKRVKKWVTEVKIEYTDWYELYFPCYYDKSNTSWAIPNDVNETIINKTGEYLFTNKFGFGDFQWFDFDVYDNIYVFGSITSEDESETNTENTEEILPQKGLIIEKVYSQNKNEYPDDGIYDNYWYIKTDESIIAYDNTDTYISLSSTNFDKYPKKGISQYQGKWYWFTYKGLKRQPLTTFGPEVLLNNVDYIQTLDTTPQFTVGKVVGASIVFDVWKPLQDVLKYVGYECIYYQKRENTDNWIQEGIFTIKEVKENGLNKTTVTAYDNAIKLNKDARQIMDKLYYPLTLYEVFIIVSAFCDIPYDLNTYFPNNKVIIQTPITFPTDQNEITCRNLLEWVAEIGGGIFIIDFDGQLLYKDMIRPTAMYGSWEAQNYSLELSKLPILKPTKIKYNDIEVIDYTATNYPDYNVLDISKNPFLSQWNEETIRSSLATALNNIRAISEIYPMSCKLGDDVKQRQCGDVWVIETNGKCYPAIITEKRINASGVFYSCKGESIPYYTEKIISDEDVDELVHFYENVFFKRIFSNIVIKDIEGTVVYTINDFNGFIDEKNLELTFTIPDVFMGTENDITYNIDFAAFINQLLFNDWTYAKGPEGIEISFDEDTLYIKDNNRWTADIVNTVYKYNMRDYEYKVWNHENNQIFEVREPLYSIKLHHVFADNPILDEKADKFYVLTSIIKQSGKTTFDAQIVNTANNTWAIPINGKQYVLFKLTGKRHFVYFYGIQMTYDPELEEIKIHLMANERVIDTEHTGEPLTINMYRNYYITVYDAVSGRPSQRLNGVGKVTFYNSVGEEDNNIFYEGDIKYIDFDAAYSFGYDEGLSIMRDGGANELGVKISYAGNSISYRAEGNKNEVSVYIDQSIDRTITFHNYKDIEGYNLYYYHGDEVPYLKNLSTTIYDEWAEADVNIEMPVIIEYIDNDEKSTYYWKYANTSKSECIKGLQADEDTYYLSNDTSGPKIQAIKLNLNIDGDDVSIINTRQSMIDEYETDTPRYRLFVDNNKYQIYEYNLFGLSSTNWTTLGTHDQSYRFGYGSRIGQREHDYKPPGGEWPNGYRDKGFAVSSAVSKIIQLWGGPINNGMDYWQFTQAPWQYICCLQGFWDNDRDISIYDLLRTFKYIQIRRSDYSGGWEV